MLIVIAPEPPETNIANDELATESKSEKTRSTTEDERMFVRKLSDFNKRPRKTEQRKTHDWRQKILITNNHNQYLDKFLRMVEEFERMRYRNLGGLSIFKPESN